MLAILLTLLPEAVQHAATAMPQSSLSDVMNGLPAWLILECSLRTNGVTKIDGIQHFGLRLSSRDFICPFLVRPECVIQ